MRAGKSSAKAVTFDLWETLLLEKDGWNLRRRNARCYRLAEALGRFGVKISVEDFSLAFEEMSPWLARIWDTDRDVTHLDQIEFILKTASKGSIALKEEWISDLSSAYISAIFEVPPFLNPDARKLLRWLKNRNRLIGLICNTGLTPGSGLRKFLTKRGVARYFDLMLFSDEVGIRKPNLEIFRRAAQKLKLRPHEIVHIGDNLKSDVWGARNAGFKAIYLSTTFGRDRIAESDPTSLVSISRKLNNSTRGQIVPDKTITSLAMAIDAIRELEFS